MLRGAAPVHQKGYRMGFGKIPVMNMDVTETPCGNHLFSTLAADFSSVHNRK
jgi:hypothetical protein